MMSLFPPKLFKHVFWHKAIEDATVLNVMQPLGCAIEPLCSRSHGIHKHHSAEPLGGWVEIGFGGGGWAALFSFRYLATQTDGDSSPQQGPQPSPEEACTTSVFPQLSSEELYSGAGGGSGGSEQCRHMQGSRGCHWVTSPLKVFTQGFYCWLPHMLLLRL